MLGFGPLCTYPLLAPPIPVVGSVTLPYYFADRAFITESDDDPPNQLWQPRVSSALNIERTLPLSPTDGRRALLQPGEIALVTADGKIDNLMNLPIDGRRVQIMVGAPGFRMAQFKTIFDGTASGWRGGDDKTDYVTLKDPSWEMDAPLQPNRYGGTGGDDGGPELTGRPIPVCYGPVRDITPVLEDEDQLIYRLHDGPIQEISDVSDRGKSYTLAGDVAGDSDDLRAAVVAPGECKTQLATGRFKVGNILSDTIITCTAKGDAAHGRYVATTAGIIFRLVHDRVGWSDGRFNLMQFQIARLMLPAPVGFYSGLTDYTFAQVIDYFCAGANFWWGVDPLGLLGIGRIEDAAAIASVFLDDRHIIDLTPLEVPDSLNPPWFEVKIGAQRCWTDLAGGYRTGISDDRRRFLSQTWRYPPPSRDAGVKVEHPQAQTVTLTSAFDSLDDAAAQQARVLALCKVRPRMVHVGLKTKGYTIPLGATVNIDHGRFGLAGGRNCYVVGQGIRAADNSSYIEVRY
jgi:hypothetical protein